MSKKIGRGTIMELDMAGIHLRVAASLFGRDLAPTLFEELETPNYWGGRIDDFVSQEPILRLLDAKTAKRIIKALTYAPLNGGNPTSRELVVKSVKRFQTTTGQPVQSNDGIINAFVRLMGASKRVLESRRIQDVILTPERERPAVWLASDPWDVYQPPSPHALPSAVYSSVEMALLTVMVETVVSRGGLLLALEHDGCLAWFDGDLDALLGDVNKDLLDASRAIIGLDVHVEVKGIWKT
jgi:hypothetical protein